MHNATLQALLSDPLKLVVPLTVFVLTVAVGYGLRRLLLGALRAWHTRTGSRPGQILTEALRRPLLIWIVILAVHLAIQTSQLPPRALRLAPQALAALFIFSLTLMSMRIAGDIVRFYGAQIPGALPVTTLTQTLAQLAVVIVGALALLAHFNISITPILTALGVGGLAVALALQDTLSNLFAGFYVAVARQVRLGDYIKMDSGHEGYVTDISWRSTTIRALSNNLIIVPNNKLAQAIVTNFHLPDTRLSSQLQVTVSLDADLDRVERALLDVAAAAINDIPGLLAEPAPSVALDPGFGESGLAFSLNYSVAEFSNQFSVRNELRKRVVTRFRHDGIEIPFATRTILLPNARGETNTSRAR
jgi:small-conductance mechanosensitive channel